MFQKVRIRLTLLCSGIITLLIIIMSFLYLRISENSLYRNQFYSFQNDSNTIIINLEQQSVITMEWLSKIEAPGNYQFYLLDNGHPFLYNTLHDTAPAENRAASSSDGNTSVSKSKTSSALSDIFGEAWTYYESTLPQDSSLEEASSLSPYTAWHRTFSFTDSGKNDYFCTLITLERNTSQLQIMILSSLAGLEKQIREQRFLFLLIDSFTVALLFLFSFFFTGKLLAPIEESRKKQLSFVAAASHELRTPLSVILSSLECCHQASPDEVAGFLATIEKQAALMKSLVNDLLTLSASDSGQLVLSRSTAELDTLLLDTFEAFEPLAARKSITMSVSLPEEALTPYSCDEMRIRQVLSILIQNAISYTPAGGHIHLALSVRNHQYLFSVADNGPGIADADKEHIFERFYRAEKSRNTKGHFGLGLSIACEIVTAHHGHLWVTDTNGGGSTFFIGLPC